MAYSEKPAGREKVQVKLAPHAQVIQTVPKAGVLRVKKIAGLQIRKSF